MHATTLQRFLDAQDATYARALSEIKSGRKQSHWMWFIFPQMKGLGKSGSADYYGIYNFHEAASYLKQPILSARLIEISNALLQLDGRTAHQILGSPDDKKLRSCMTLFSLVPNTDPVFKMVLHEYFEGECDILTLNLLEKTMKRE